MLFIIRDLRSARRAKYMAGKTFEQHQTNISEKCKIAEKDKGDKGVSG
jgi:hypothetical protein